MRKFITSIGLLALVASLAGAQTVAPPYAEIGFDDGVAETSYKVSAPSATGDFFSVDFDALAAGQTIIGLVAVLNDNGVGQIRRLGIYLDNLAVDPTGTTPDVSAAGIVTELILPTGSPSTFCIDDRAYDIPDFVHPSTNSHVGFNQIPGDSTMWMCTDTSTDFVAGRSYFSTNTYSTAAIPFNVDWMLRMATPEGPAGTFLINGSSTAYTLLERTGTSGEDVTLSFWGNSGATSERCILGAFLPGFLKLLSGATGLFPPGAAANVFAVTGAGAGPVCGDVPRDFTIGMGGFWGDTVDTKPNGRPKSKATNRVALTFANNPDCTRNECFGRKSDDIMDATIFKISNPAGPADYFNVQHDTTANNYTPVNNLTSVEVATWDFCGNTQSWSVVGVYDTNWGLDPTGSSPDLNLPISTYANATILSNVGDWAFPASVYDIPDVAANTTTAYHAVVGWQSGDSCVWIGGDTDGIDDDTTIYGRCSVLPNTTSHLSATGYTTPAGSWSTQNMMIRINWN